MKNSHGTQIETQRTDYTHRLLNTDIHQKKKHPHAEGFTVLNISALNCSREGTANEH